MSSSSSRDHDPAAGSALEGVKRAMAAIDALPKPQPMTIVSWPMAMRGKAWQMLDEGHLYAFVHPDDLAAIPTAPASLLGYAGVPVRRFDDEMRAVFMRGLERLAAAEEADRSSAKPIPGGRSRDDL